VGHGRAEIADAVGAQMRTLAAYHAFERFTTEPADRLSEQLADLAPFSDARVFLVGSGSEAVDSAIKLARVAHAQAGRGGRSIVISRRPSYHGVTYGGMAATGLPLNQQGFGPMLGDVVQVPYDDLAAVKEIFGANPDRVAAVIAEPVVGAGGVFPAPAGYLQGLRALCDEHGAYLILDEVICGFGRLGEWWGARRYDVEPDLVTFAKGVTSGYQPLGGVLIGAGVREPLEADSAFLLRHGHTYSGHPAACAAALVVLEITRREALLERAGPLGARLADGLRTLEADGLVTEVRGDGAMWAAELEPSVAAVDVREAMLDRGVIARPIANAMAFCPPLVATDEQIDHCVEALGDAVRAVRAR